ncbi:MAG TPA: alpha/beta hydrolase [Hyphomicrobiaceae bacterium]|nr:alpha/beta hydrolase [Hyphomicrobiaceae bacterium]
MRTADVDILIIPGWTNSGPDHWQSRWQRNLKTARRVEQADWDTPKVGDWVERIAAAVANASRPAVLVAHSCGVTAVAHAASALPREKIAGAFLVAPTDPEAAPDIWPHASGGFSPLPLARLPLPSRVIASSNDPYCSVERAQVIAAAWGADISIIANAGHINTDSGHGPWPEGLLSFGLFLKSLGESPAKAPTVSSH